MLRVLKAPFACAAANFLVLPLLTGFLGSATQLLLFNTLRLAIMGWAGWLVVRNGSGLWAASLAGVLIMLLDHVVLKGGSFLAMHFADPASMNDMGLMAFGGVVVSFVMFSPVAAISGVLGGIVARAKQHQKLPNQSLHSDG